MIGLTLFLIGRSIKSSTRQRRSKAARPIRRVIESREIPLPVKWSNFISLSKNMSNLIDFLSNELIMSGKIDKTVVVAGGFVDEMVARSNGGTLILYCFKAAHEEADTRLVLHAINNEAENIVVLARDIDGYG